MNIDSTYKILKPGHITVNISSSRIKIIDFVFQPPITKAYSANLASTTIVSLSTHHASSFNSLHPSTHVQQSSSVGMRTNLQQYSNNITTAPAPPPLGTKIQAGGLIKVRKQDGSFVWLRVAPQTSTGNMPIRLTPVSISSAAQPNHFIRNPGSVPVYMSSSSIPSSTESSMFDSVQGAETGLISSSSSSSLTSRGTAWNSIIPSFDSTPVNNQSLAQSYSGFGAQESNYSGRPSHTYAQGFQSSDVHCQDNLPQNRHNPPQNMQNLAQNPNNSPQNTHNPPQGTQLIMSTNLLPCPLIELSSGGSVSSTYEAWADNSLGYKTRISKDEDSVSDIKPLR